MQTEDIETIYQMGSESRAFTVSDMSTFWSKESLYQWIINNKQDVLLVAEDGSKIMGFIMTQVHGPTGKATIENIYVDKLFRGRGIGLKLLKECLKCLKEKRVAYVCAMVKTENEPTLKFFESLGFKKGYNFAWMEADLQ